MDAWNNIQVFYVRSAAMAYVELYLFNEFYRGYKRCRDSNTKVIYSLSSFENQGCPEKVLRSVWILVAPK